MSPHFRDNLFTPRWVIVGCSPDAGLAHTSLNGDQSRGNKRLVVPTLMSMGVVAIATQTHTHPMTSPSFPVAPLSRGQYVRRLPDAAAGLTDSLTVIYDTRFT